MGKIFCLMGKSATGKDTLFDLIMEACPKLKNYVMYSTRPMRSGETDGVNYHFVSEDALLRFAEDGKLIEKRVYQTVKGPWIYATVDDGQINPESVASYLLPATLESYRKLREYYGEEYLVPLYIEAPDELRLLRSIGRESQQKEPDYREVCRRFLADEEDFSEEMLALCRIEKRYQNIELEKCRRELIADIEKLS